jgi:DNA-binding NarL/FixJ family response regulator
MVHTVLIADDSGLIRKAIRRVLSEEPSIEIVGEAESFENAISLTRDVQPDTLLLDLHMPDDGFLRPAYIKANLSPVGSKTHIIGISLSSDKDDDTRALGQSLGAFSVLDKASLDTELIPAILALK